MILNTYFNHLVFNMVTALKINSIYFIQILLICIKLILLMVFWYLNCCIIIIIIIIGKFTKFS